MGPRARTLAHATRRYNTAQRFPTDQDHPGPATAKRSLHNRLAGLKRGARRAGTNEMLTRGRNPASAVCAGDLVDPDSCVLTVSGTWGSPDDAMRWTSHGALAAADVQLMPWHSPPPHDGVATSVLGLAKPRARSAPCRRLARSLPPFGDRDISLRLGDHAELLPDAPLNPRSNQLRAGLGTDTKAER